MATDVFLKLEGIKGESKDDKHKGEIDVESFSWGASQQGTMASAGGGGAGKANFQDLHLTSYVSVASPNLFLKVATGTHIPSGTIAVRKAGEGQQEYLTIKLTDILVSSYQLSGSGSADARPMESISLNYAKIEIEYKEQKPDGSLGAASKVGYDLKLNKKV